MSNYDDVRRICANCAYWIQYQIDPDGHCNSGGREHGWNKEPDDSCEDFEVCGSIKQRRR